MSNWVSSLSLPLSLYLYTVSYEMKKGRVKVSMALKRVFLPFLSSFLFFPKTKQDLFSPTLQGDETWERNGFDPTVTWVFGFVSESDL